MTKPVLAVNKKGFTSVYAIMLLQIVLVFVLLFFACTKSMLLAQKMDTHLHQETLLAIYLVKQHLKEEILEEETAPMEEDLAEDEGEQEASFVEEQRTYEVEEGRILIHYEEEQASVLLSNGVSFYLSVDREEKAILDLVY